MSTVIDERFEIRRRLGAGGMGEVFEAFDRDRDETVALKTLRHPNPGSLYLFKKEFRSLADVSHPNLVSLYELVVDQEQWFFTMELVDGDSLKDYVHPLDQTMPISVGPEPEVQPVINVPRLRSALAQLASGVQAVHDAGRLHRDLKPSNIMVTRQGRLVILDFGVATELTPMMNLRSIDTGIAGTAAYMAPEQARGEPARAASDWYAVGVILFEVLTGRWPFTGSLARILIDKQFTEAPRPGTLVGDLPADLAALCSALLEPEPDSRPSGPEILERLGGGGEPGLVSAPSPEETFLVGRRSHLAALERAFADTQDGHAVTIHVHGPSGIGKTALIHHFLHQLMERTQAVVLSGRCYEHEMVPYKALDGVVDNLSRYLRTLHKSMVEELMPVRIDALSRLFPVLLRVEAVASAADSWSETGRMTTEVEGPDRPHLRRQALRALRQLLKRVVSLQPLVLHVDDLQWADSAAMLREVMAGPDAPPVLLITSFRSEEMMARPFLAELLSASADDGGSQELAVAGLSEAEAREYIVHTLGPRPGTDYLVETVVQEADGSPFFLEQLTRHALSSQSGVSAGISLAEMLEERLQQLPRGSVDLLNVLAAAGRPIDRSVAVEAARLGDDGRRLLTTLKRAYLVRGSTFEQDVELYHDRFRQALGARLSRAEARRVHSRLLATLEARGIDDPELLLEQATRAGDEKKAAQLARRAAEKAAAALAYERATELYRQALDLSVDNPAVSLIVRDRLAETLAFSGRTREAADLHLELANAHVGVESLRYRRAATMEYLISGYTDRGMELASSVLDATGLRLPKGRFEILLRLAFQRLKLRLRGLSFEPRQEERIAADELLRIDTCWAMASGLSMADTFLAAEFQSRHLLAALEAGEPHRIARALAMEIAFQSTPGRSARQRTQQLYEQALEIAQDLGDGYVAALATMQRGITFYLNGEWRSAVQLSDSAEAMFLDCPGCAVWEVVTARRFALSGLAFMGEMKEVARRLPVQLEEARARGNVYGTNELLTRLNLFWLARDDPEQAEREIAEASATWSQKSFHLSHHSILVARAQTALYRGRGVDALAAVEAQWPQLEASLLLRIQAMRIEARALRARSLLGAALEKGAREQRQLLRRALTLANQVGRESLAIGRPLGLMARAAVGSQRGDQDAARQDLEEAAIYFESCDMKLHVHAARRRLGELVGGGEGEGLRRNADDAMEGLGVANPRRMARMLAPGFLAP